MLYGELLRYSVEVSPVGGVSDSTSSTTRLAEWWAAFARASRAARSESDGDDREKGLGGFCWAVAFLPNVGEVTLVGVARVVGMVGLRIWGAEEVDGGGEVRRKGALRSELAGSLGSLNVTVLTEVGVAILKLKWHCSEILAE